MKRFVEKTAIIEAVQFTGSNIQEVFDALYPEGYDADTPENWWVMRSGDQCRLHYDRMGFTQFTVISGMWVKRDCFGRFSLEPDDYFREIFVAVDEVGAQP